jgi:putative inorganic carbon (HCO3(-)) transporter
MRDGIRQAFAWLFSIEVILVTMMMGVSLVFPSMLWLPVGGGVFYLMVRRIVAGKWSRATPIDLPMGILGVMGVISYGISPLKEISLIQVLRLLSGMVFFLALVNGIPSRKWLEGFVWLLLVSGVLLVISSPITVTWVENPVTRVFGMIRDKVGVTLPDTVHPNVLAGTLVLLFPIPAARLFYFWKETPGWQRILYGLFGLLFLTTMVIAQSRGAVLAVLVVLAFLSLTRWKWGWALILMAVAPLSGILMRVGTSTILQLLVSSPGLGGWDERVELWSRAIYMIQDFPFTGVGFGLFSPVADTLYPFFLMQPGQMSHAHNLFLQVAVDTGLPGLIAWMSCLFITSWMAWKVYRLGSAGGGSWARYMGMAMLGVNIGLVAHGCLDAAVWGMMRPAPLVWGLWGVNVAAFFLAEKNSR